MPSSNPSKDHQPVFSLATTYDEYGSGRSLVVTFKVVEKVSSTPHVTRFKFAGSLTSRPSAVPEGIALDAPLLNPGLPAHHSTQNNHLSRLTVGSGLNRTYLDRQSTNPTYLNKQSTTNAGYPPRPVLGSIADLDIIMDHCDFSANKYVRDCLEVLRVGAGLDNGKHVRRGPVEAWNYIYVEEGQRLTMPSPPKPATPSVVKQDKSLEPPLFLPPARSYWTSSELATACDPDHPRIFHIFWGGEFTTHPHMVILSFLFTQNLGLHLPSDAPASNVCRPQLWIWMQMGLAIDANPGPGAAQEMYESLRTNPWSAPFLHSRFKDVIKFKLWNTTEQLDNIRELKDEWRLTNLFNSAGHVYRIPEEDSSTTISKRDSELLKRMSSTSSQSRDQMRTILSDMARFVVCHRFGGVYLDADTLILRDWEELFGWKGAFAYRWSRLPKYNTAVLKLNKGSALGTFLIRTALRHKLDFHPMHAITNYLNDADLDGLLLRLPDALFDSPWLNTENYQRDRPPAPSYVNFEHFFDTPPSASAEAQALGFDGFFRGAFSYHWHNNWWRPFDATRNWPDLGPRFAQFEQTGRIQAREAAAAAAAASSHSKKSKSSSHAKKRASGSGSGSDASPRSPLPPANAGEDDAIDDKRDLDWSAILKRTFEAYIRGERPNMYGEWIEW
ncbi:snoRNA binding protein [Hysterangium stoloniferum]|nr:snoRNA binding protein [Hysterangium stoloniferum]